MNNKKRILSMILILAICFTATSVCGYAEGDWTTDVSSLKEESKNTQPQNDPIIFDAVKIEELLTLPPATLENMGISVRDLTKMGVPLSQAQLLVSTKFSPIHVNVCLQNIGSTKRVSLARALETCTCNVSVNTGVTVDGNNNQKFHSSIALSSIADSVIKARGIARAVFGYESTSSATSYVKSNYFLFGEHDCALGITHEGIDVRFTDSDHESFRTLSGGKIVAVNMSATGFGTLVIKHPTEATNILFLHADSYIPAVQQNASILGSTFIGNQGGRVGLDADKLTHHVHIETRTTSYTGPAQDKDTTLGSKSPYASLWPYVATEYR